MSNVLYITANPKVEAKSYSLQVGRAFIDAYKKLNPNHSVTEIEVYESDIPFIDRDILTAWEELGSGTDFKNLTHGQQDKISRYNAFTDQFIAADKYVLVTPMWNLAIPAMMKAYLDTATVVGKTFKYTANGPIGLLENKKAVHIHASGGIYSSGPTSSKAHADSYVRDLLTFIGIKDIQSILVEGMAYNPNKAEEIKQQAIAKAIEVVKNF